MRKIYSIRRRKSVSKGAINMPCSQQSVVFFKVGLLITSVEHVELKLLIQWLCHTCYQYKLVPGPMRFLVTRSKVTGPGM